MNFKERGITVGDIVIFSIIIISSIFIINKFKDNDDQSHLNISPNEILIIQNS